MSWKHKETISELGYHWDMVCMKITKIVLLEQKGLKIISKLIELDANSMSKKECSGADHFTSSPMKHC